ncbi:MAG: hypothetical protein FJ087_01530 [Deltaproteobacteria bacterium]|nr:hypothetical protein [Deltaproteobacteria bacterium]
MTMPHLGTDILVRERDVVPAAQGDVELATGEACLAQDLAHRLGTPKGDLRRHPTYGVGLYRFLHLDATDVHVLDFQHSIAEEAEKDPRVEPGTAVVEVLSWDAREKIKCRLTCRPIGSSNPLVLVLGYDLARVTLEVVRGG